MDVTNGGAGKAAVYGAPGSMNCMGPILLAKDLGLGDMEMMMPYATTEEFNADFPKKQVPALKHGGLKIAE